MGRDAYTVTVEDTRADYGERRFATLGLFKGRLATGARTETSRKIRIISAQGATRGEEQAYFEGIND